MFNIINHYHPSSPPQASSFLDLGGALTAVGLIGLVYQFRTPLWTLILSIKTPSQRNLIWIFSGAGLLVILLKVLLFGDQWVKEGQSLLTNPIYYELIACILFIIGPLSTIWFASNLKIFTRKNCKKFYKKIVEEISKNDDKHSQAAFEIFMANFDDICSVMKCTNKDASHLAIDLANEVLSDNYIVELLTTKRLDSLIYFFECIEKNQLSSKGNFFVSKISQNLFLNHESFFYKHLSMDGLALSSNIYRIFYFENLIKKFPLLDSHQLGYLYGNEFKAIRADVLITAMKHMICAYKQFQNIPIENITYGLKNVSELFHNLCLKIRRLEKKEIDIFHEYGEEWLALQLLSGFLGEFKGINNNTTPISKEMDILVNLNQEFAKALSKSIGSLSLIKDSTVIYQNMISLLNGLEIGTPPVAEYVNEFEKEMWGQIAKNVVSRLYPPYLKGYLIYFGGWLPPDSCKLNQGSQAILENIRKLLYVDLKPLLDQNALMANGDLMKNALLPPSLIYENGEYAYIDRFNQSRRIILPPQDETSIIATVKPILY
ncbi:MAG: hypothetical protein BGO14_00150 [Chlamydiales bacterium 38-26]|nr:hypothetical protein [Chlamydiales bacterium]OJV07477.1 MAG: hypothetical protein BGO14_00150 [Chlamydiales bacterium 38-26]